ncbi:MAG: prepilin-type N-terminal cleavage/methylation domain-containing protein [Omnitrophica bacterium]|nr:prepilin-type N-terminal cleavage/methylation domain-containing protein [Candidatus Omnitrophota bacterium]
MNKKSSGFTLIEILIAALISLILLAALFLIFFTGNSSWQMGNVRIELQQDLRRAMDWTSDELRQSGSSVISGVPSDGTPYNTITFRIPTGVTGTTISWDPTQIQYSLGGPGGRQLLRTYALDQRVLANNITSFEIRRQPLTSAILEVALEAEKSTPKGILIQLKLDFEVKLRN